MEVGFRLTRSVRRLVEEAIHAIRTHHPEVADDDGALFQMVSHTAECQVGGLPGLERLARRYPIHERDGWTCMAPGCSRTGSFARHHVILRSKGGPDEGWVLVTVCSVHHELVHDGVVGCWLDLERIFAQGDATSAGRVFWGFGRLPAGGWWVLYRGDRRVPAARAVAPWGGTC